MDGVELSQARIAENQSRFREANENIEAGAEKAGFQGAIPFICECADNRCMEIVQLTFQAYETVRQHPRRFFNVHGHERLSVDAGAAVVVERLPGYVLTDKIGEAGEIAEAAHDALPQEEERGG